MMPLGLYDLEQWKGVQKRMVPTGECICAGCTTRLKKRKYSTIHFDHLESVEQPYKYCRKCLKAGHDMLFQRKYEILAITKDGRPVPGKRLPFTEDIIVEGQSVQRGMHGIT